MSEVNVLIQALERGDYSGILEKLYPSRSVAEQIQRLKDLAGLFADKYGVSAEPLRMFSAPGRTEIGGNHTDHQNGNILAAAINRDAVAVASKNDDSTVSIQSVGYSEDIIDLEELERVDDEENGSIAMIRGICARFENLGYIIGGFNAYTTSDVPSGSGLSSSAAFANLVATILNYLYNDGKIDPVTIAQIGQYAENEYFGKPSGLMDQATSAVGGLITIDFADKQNPKIKQISFDIASSDHALCTVETGGSHADLTDDYADISNDMFNVAAFFEKDVLRDVSEDKFYQQLNDVREKTSDRAVLRAMHFFGDNTRVLKQVEALERSDFGRFKELMIESGRSSFTQLQNIYSCKHPTQQGLSLALALSERILSPYGGAWRVHGGGFGGTILALVPLKALAEYKKEMDDVFGENACQELAVRSVGATEITK